MSSLLRVGARLTVTFLILTFEWNEIKRRSNYPHVGRKLPRQRPRLARNVVCCETAIRLELVAKAALSGVRLKRR
jgi:hypothetical protein